MDCPSNMLKVAQYNFWLSKQSECTKIKNEEVYENIDLLQIADWHMILVICKLYWNCCVLRKSTKWKFDLLQIIILLMI